MKAGDDQSQIAKLLDRQKSTIRRVLIRSAIVDKIKPIVARVKTLTFDNDKEFAAHAHIDQLLQSTT
jgi:IS30 family transposase